MASNIHPVRRVKNPELEAKIKQMALPLRPLVSLSIGDPHPAFPLTLLNFWLLTSDQLDDMAHFYHQRTPNDLTALYPCPVEWRTDATLEEKRRRIGRFIGLRGCESPIPIQCEEEIREEVRRARWREDEELMFRRKMGPGRF